MRRPPFRTLAGPDLDLVGNVLAFTQPRSAEPRVRCQVSLREQSCRRLAG